jgi:hypothetical protein
MKTHSGSFLPRLELTELEPSLAAYLAPRVKRLGYFGEFFKCSGHKPRALMAFMQFTEASKEGLPDRLTELIALTVAGWMDNAYERNQHERLAVRLGFGRAWVAGVNQLAPEDRPELTPDERSLQRLLLTILESKGKRAGALFEEAVQRFGAEQAVGMLMVAGRYIIHSIIVNSLDLAPPVPSIFEDGFDG